MKAGGSERGLEQETGYTIGQLARAGDVTTRSIRYYTAEGLLPPPDTRGRHARYSQNHLQRLRAIARLKRDYLPLHIIRERLNSLTDAQVAALGAGEMDTTSQPRLSPGRQATERFAEETESVAPGALEVVESELALPATRKRVALLVSPRLAPQTENALEQTAEEETHFDPSDLWQRIPLAPGVELHVRVPDSPQTFETLHRLIQETKALFQKPG